MIVAVYRGNDITVAQASDSMGKSASRMLNKLFIVNFW
jgi:hypothetical protein